MLFSFKNVIILFLTEHPDSDHKTDDPYNETGLRKTTFSDIYNENGEKPKITRGRSIDANITRSRSNSMEKPESSPFKRQSITYRSARPGSAMGKVNNTWNSPRVRQRSSITAETFNKPSKKYSVPSPTPKSKIQYDQNGRRIINSTNSSPTKSPLRQELLKAAESLNDDAEMLNKIKNILKQYGPFDCKKDSFEDFTSAWVNNSKKDSCEDTKVYTPRKDSKPENNVSKIPAPVYKRSTLNLC